MWKLQCLLFVLKRSCISDHVLKRSCICSWGLQHWNLWHYITEYRRIIIALRIKLNLLLWWYGDFCLFKVAPVHTSSDTEQGGVFSKTKWIKTWKKRGKSFYIQYNVQCKLCTKSAGWGGNCNCYRQLHNHFYFKKLWINNRSYPTV